MSVRSVEPKPGQTNTRQELEPVTADFSVIDHKQILHYALRGNMRSHTHQSYRAHVCWHSFFIRQSVKPLTYYVFSLVNVLTS